MREVSLRRPLVVLVVCAGAAFLAGCGSSSVKQSDEVKNVQNFLTSHLTDLPKTKSVDCPSGVSTKVGTTFECTATLVNGQVVTVPLLIKTSGSNGGTMGANGKVINNALAVDLIYHDAPAPPKTVSCPTNVPAQTGKTFTCTATLSDGSKHTITVHIDNATPQGVQHLSIANVKTS